MRILLVLVLAATLLTACAGPMGMAYTVTSIGSVATTGRSTTEHMAGQLADADCSIWRAVVDGTYICERNPNPADTYNRNPF